MSGYLSSLSVIESSVVGTSLCPWKIVAPQGQRINLTLFDLYTPSIATEGTVEEPELLERGSRWCRDGWILVVGEHNMSVEIPGCGVMSTVRRQRAVYTSRSNELSVHLEHRSSLTAHQFDQHILIKYQGWFQFLILKCKWYYYENVKSVPLLFSAPSCLICRVRLIEVRLNAYHAPTVYLHWCPSVNLRVYLCVYNHGVHRGHYPPPHHHQWVSVGAWLFAQVWSNPIAMQFLVAGVQRAINYRTR